jgi:hypothetical protein
MKLGLPVSGMLAKTDVMALNTPLKRGPLGGVAVTSGVGVAFGVTEGLDML